MRRHPFLQIVEALGNHSEYFQVRYDAIRKRGLSPLTKFTAAMQMLTYSMTADFVDEYLKLGASTALECMNNLVNKPRKIMWNTFFDFSFDFSLAF